MATVPVSLAHDELRHRILEHLGQILASTAFRSSRRSQDFLRYVVTETLAGRGEHIKERSIATAVFGRGDQYEPAEDSIVRVKAAELRKRLAGYYAENPVKDVAIELKPGSYVPVFRRPTAETSPRRGNQVIIAVAVAVAAAVVAAALLPRLSEPSPNVLSLWKPILEGRSPVLIGVPSPNAINLQGASAEAARRGPTKPVLVPPEDIVRRDLYWVGIGAAHGAARFAAYLGAHGKTHFLKTHAEISMDDLRLQPSLLLGGTTSPWARELTKNLRFRMAFQDKWRIVDTRQPDRTWVGSLTPQAGLPHDYAIVARVFDPSTKQVFLEAAGLTPHGTRAAAEFVTDEASFSQFTATAPAGWQHRNLQIVLRCNVPGSSPGPPEVVAVEIW